MAPAFLSESILRLNTARSLTEWIEVGRVSRDRTALASALMRKPALHAHLRSGALEIAAAQERIEGGEPIVVVSHQPTLFPYSGVYVQFLLAEAVISHLREQHGCDPVLIYLCLDADDTFDRRIKTAHLPMPTAGRGSLALSVPLDGKWRGRAQFAVPAPSEAASSSWLKSIDGAFAQLGQVAGRAYRGEILAARSRILAEVGRLVARVHAVEPQNFADSAASLMLHFVQTLLTEPVIVVRMTDLVYHGWAAFMHLLSGWEDVQSAALQQIASLRTVNVEIGSGSASDPAWDVCGSCGLRRAVSLEDARLLAAQGAFDQRTCTHGVGGEPPVALYPTLLPRVLLEDLLTVALTDAALILTYAGSAEHVVIADHTVPCMLGRPSPIFTCHPRQVLACTVERIALTLLREGRRTAESLEALGRAVNGRDPLLHCLGDVPPSDHARAWRTHFTDRTLADTMVLRPDDAVSEAIQRTVAVR